MRVTTSMVFTNSMRNVNTNLEKYLKATETLTTEKKINRPSDDPTSAARASTLNTILGRFEQFQRNASSATSFVDAMETALENVYEDLSRAREIAVDINGGNATGSDYQAAAGEVEQLFQDVLMNANAKSQQRYLFSGYSTRDEPFDDAGNYLGGVNQDIEIQISENNYITINKDGNEVFKNPVDVFQVLADLETAISSGDQNAITNMIPTVETALNQIIQQKASIGSVTKRLETAIADNDAFIEAYTAILSSTTDVDVAKATTDFSFAEQVYQSTLLVSQKVLNTSVLDFLS